MCHARVCVCVCVSQLVENKERAGASLFLLLAEGQTDYGLRESVANWHSRFAVCDAFFLFCTSTKAFHIARFHCNAAISQRANNCLGFPASIFFLTRRSVVKWQAQRDPQQENFQGGASDAAKQIRQFRFLKVMIIKGGGGRL